MIQLFNGDCLELMDTLEDNCIDLAILDLPYGQTDCPWDNKIDINILWQKLKRIGKSNTAFIFFCTTKFGIEIINSNPKMFRYDLVWDKPNGSAGFLNAKKMPIRGHEMIYVFYDKLPFYNIADNHQPINSKTNHEQLIHSDIYKTKINRVTGAQWTPLLPRSILSFPITNKRKNKLHSTEKPMDLIKWIIKYYSKENDVIFDPTFGCGTTAVACKELNRRFIGIEKDEKFFNLAQQRIDELN
jgi:site-specific DNA-methyltransferase (adenine-specific)